MNSQVWWFVARSAGIVAWLLVTLSVCWGLLLSTRLLAKSTPAPWLLDLHRFLSTLSIVFTAVHLGGLVLDDYVYFGLAELFVPFAYEAQAGDVAWGIVALYLLIAVESTSLLMRRIPRRMWRSVHRLSFLVYGFATMHGWRAGSDTGNPLYAVAVVASVFVVTFLTLAMLLGARPSRSPSRPSAPTSMKDRELSQK